MQGNNLNYCLTNKSTYIIIVFALLKCHNEIWIFYQAWRSTQVAEEAPLLRV